MYFTLIIVRKNRFYQSIDDDDVEVVTQRRQQIVKASSLGTSPAGGKENTSEGYSAQT